MTVILINPNSTEAMTLSALKAARTAAPEITFEGWTSHAGPPSIEGPDDGDAAIGPLLALVAKASQQGAQAIIIACFDDTGLKQARAIAHCPVIGIGQASFVLAAAITNKAAVITTVQEAVPVITQNIADLGLAGTIAHVCAANVPVLMLDSDPKAATRLFLQKAQSLPAEISVLILGCSGAVTIAAELRQTLSMRVMDGVTSAARLCQAIAAET